MSECRACASNLKGIFHYRCVGCCARHIEELPNKEAKERMFDHLVRFNSSVEGFAEELKQKWSERVKSRREAK